MAKRAGPCRRVLRGRLKKPYPDSVAEHEEIREVIADEIKAGDVVVIPAGTGHWFTRIEDHIDYIMVRIDPDKVTPLKSEAQSAEYLSNLAKRGE